MHFLGFNVMPRRIPNFPDSFHFWNFLSSIGSGITFLSFAMFSYKDCFIFVVSSLSRSQFFIRIHSCVLSFSLFILFWIFSLSYLSQCLVQSQCPFFSASHFFIFFFIYFLWLHYQSLLNPIFIGTLLFSLFYCVITF